MHTVKNIQSEMLIGFFEGLLNWFKFSVVIIVTFVMETVREVEAA